MLAFAGLRDGATPLRTFSANPKFHRAPNQVVEVDAGHFVLEERPEVVVPKVVEFLREHGDQR